MTRVRKVTPAMFPQPRKCGGKNCYASKQLAETAKTEQELLVPGLKLTIYRCNDCGTWHLTRST